MKMYSRIITIFILFFFISVSCEEVINDLLTFDSQYYIFDFSVDPIDRTGYHIFTEEISKSNLDSLLEANSLSKEKLQEVITKETIINITDPDASTTFDPLEKLSVTIYTKALGETTIAAIDPIPRGLNELTLVLEDCDLKDYLYEDEFILSAIGVLKERTYKTITMQAKVKFQFRAGL